jgi:heparanase
MMLRVMIAVSCCAPAFSADTTVNPSSMPAIGQVDTRFQAYNIEMLEVTGGRFWKPYKEWRSASEKASEAGKSAAAPAGMNPNLYQYRPPLNLANARLRKLARALGPTYMRVSGTWANTTYFQDTDGPAPVAPPKGFNGVLTREQWKGVVDFAQAVNAEMISSFAISPGTRNAEGVWTPEQARAFLAYTNSVGGKIAAAEFMNEPNLSVIGGAPRGYTPSDYARDVAVFRPFLKQTSPGTLFLGPGSVAETSTAVAPRNLGILRSEDLLKATGPVYDVFSYHLYPAVSQRCAGMSPKQGTTAAAALSDEWLARPDEISTFYASLRDRSEPGKPIWITETADAACGGNSWASTFLDTFRYLDEHGRLAQQGVRVVAHNTLAASDYALVDENTFTPRPNYWAALLWHNLMGRTVLKPAPAASAHVYAHCLSNVPGGVTVLAINNDGTAAKTLNLSVASDRYTLTAPHLEDTRVDLNGKELKLGVGDSIPLLAGVPTPAGPVTLPPASITFLSIREAHNASCQQAESK